MESDGASTVNKDALIQGLCLWVLAKEQARKSLRSFWLKGILYSPKEGKIKHSQS